jgi:tetratricopeptide (TPR) repeat protein
VLLDEALALDPNYVQALLAKSFADLILRTTGVITREEEQRRWQDIKTRVLEIDPEDGLLNTYLVWESAFDYRDFEQANEHLQLALRHGLNDMEALRTLEGVARRTGNFDAAGVIGRRRTAIDPTCQRCFWQFSESLFYAGLFEQAIAAKKRFQLITVGAGGFYHHAQALLLLGDYEAALEVVRSKESAAKDSQDVAIMAMAAWSMQDMSSFEKYVEELKQSELAHVSQLVAEVYSWAGDADQAFAWIDKAIEADLNIHWHLFLPIWENLRDDPRWKELRERLSWTDEQLAALDFSALRGRD